MNEKLEAHWNDFQKKLPEEQIFCLFVMIIFNAYKRTQRGETASQEFTQSYFLQAFLDIRKYDVKEAIFRLNEKVDWILLENDRELQRMIRSISETIFDFFRNTSESELDLRYGQLDILMEAVLESVGARGKYAATPRSIRRLIEELLSGITSEKTADFCCGIAISGIGICRKKRDKYSNATLYGADVDSVLCAIGIILMELYQVSGTIEQKDILSLPEKSESTLYDLIFLDIPRGSNKSVPYDRRDPRITNFEKSSVYPDWIFIQDALYHLDEGGYAVVLCTNGALVRANELSLRKQAVEHDWLEAVISLPSNLYPNTRTGTELLIFHKGKTLQREKKVLFIDINQSYFREKRNAYSISEEGRKIACSCFKEYREVEGISVIQKSSLLDLRTYSFKPIQYIHQEQGDEKTKGVALSEIAQITRGAQILKKNIDTAEETAFFINIKDIQDGAVVYDAAESVSIQNPVCKRKFRIQEDDILITSKGTALKIAIIERMPPLTFISGNITLIRVRGEQYNPYVLFHYLDSEQGRAALERIQSGTTIRILNNTNLSALKVPRYQLEQMHRIGALLKAKRKAYFKEQKMLTENYNKEKSSLLDSLKEEL